MRNWLNYVTVEYADRIKTVVPPHPTPTVSKFKSLIYILYDVLFVSVNSINDGKEKYQVLKKSKKKDRFEGVPITDILQKKLPDHLAPNLDLLFVCFLYFCPFWWKFYPKINRST